MTEPIQHASALAPIIRKHEQDTNKPFPSPSFQSPPSPINSDPSGSYFSLPTVSPTHSGILLNKPNGGLIDPTAESSHATSKSPPAIQSPSFGLGLVENHDSIATALARVGSPDTELSSTDESSVAGSTSTAPSSTFGSPDLKPSATLLRPHSPAESMATLSLANLPEGHSQVADQNATEQLSASILRQSRSPSPHCHFAPLPKVEQQERPGTRRNSAAQGNGLRGKNLTADGEPMAFEMDESPFPASNLTSSLLNIKNGTATSPAVGFRRTSGSFSGRSASPSPPRRPSSSASSNRSHSPPMISRHASQDALHLHRIQATSGRPNRSSSREREREWEVASPPLGASSRVASRDRDDWPQDTSATSASATGRSSPAVSDGDQPRRAMAFVEPERGISGRCKPTTRTRSISIVDGGVEREVVEVDPQSGVEEDLDDLDEEEEDRENSEGEDQAEDTEGEEDAIEDDNEDGEAEDEEDEEQEDEEELQALASKTAQGAGVEVVHWHKEEHDTSPSTPTLSTPTPATPVPV